MATYIFLVIGDDWESSAVLQAFAARRDAKACAAACREHDAKKPNYPMTVDDTPENDAAFAKADRAMKRWCNKHPGGAGLYGCLSYSVQRIRLDPPSAPQPEQQP